MDKYNDKTLIDWNDDIILLNDNYSAIGLKKGYIGTVVENLINTKGIVTADFFNPITGEDIAVLAEIKKEDFSVYSGSKKDQRIGKTFKDLFRK